MFRIPGFPHSKYLQYNDEDWKCNNTIQFNLADGDCSKSEAVAAESDRLCKDTIEKKEKAKTEVERKFDQRISDVDHWKNESDRCIAKLQDALDKLLHYKTRADQAAVADSDAILACKKAMLERDKRQGVDMVQDKPQREIQKYMVLMQDVQAIFDKILEDIEDLMISHRAAKRRLLHDVTDKQMALEIDTHASGCRPENFVSRNFQFDVDLMSPKEEAITPAEWERSTRRNIDKAEQEIKRSSEFGVFVENALYQTFNDLAMQRQRVLDALEDRVKELCDAKEKLEKRLARIDNQLLDTEESTKKLEQAMDNNLRSLELAANRMESRRQRPRNELVRDQVDNELEDEARQLNLSVVKLDDQKAQVKDMQRKLNQTKLALQKEIETKKNSIHIDRNRCINMIFGEVTHIKH